MTDPLLILGALGGCIVLTLFLLEQTDRISNKNFWYDGLNMVGSGLLLLYALHSEAWPFVATNSVWFAFSLKDTFVALGKKRK